MSDKFFILTLLSAQLVNSPSLPFVPLQKFRSRIALPPSRIIDLTMAQTSVSPPPLRPSKANTHKVYSTSISQLSNPNSRITCSRNHGSCKFRFTYFSRSGFFLFNFLGDLVGSHLQYKVALCQLLVSPDREENIARARSRIEAAADAGAMLIVMPASRPLTLSIFFNEPVILTVFAALKMGKLLTTELKDASGY